MGQLSIYALAYISSTSRSGSSSKKAKGFCPLAKKIRIPIKYDTSPYLLDKKFKEWKMKWSKFWRFMWRGRIRRISAIRWSYKCKIPFTFGLDTLCICYILSILIELLFNIKGLDEHQMVWNNKEEYLTYNRTISFPDPFQITRINNQITYKPSPNVGSNQTG